MRLSSAAGSAAVAACVADAALVPAVVAQDAVTVRAFRRAVALPLLALLGNHAPARWAPLRVDTAPLYGPSPQMYAVRFVLNSIAAVLFALCLMGPDRGGSSSGNVSSSSNFVLFVLVVKVAAAAATVVVVVVLVTVGSK